ncbi:acyltransferase family protein [Pontibacter silvestris]|uniref:Acyltransferase family protein n=1 Tax=Pontibacter silvestris TaxID=2305183 RepID=A0ABW4WWT1_9BACT|nr:acyltransferase [Pontibacter silvestris]MCC9136546.1 acyltransferase [Pontibacter silvestris]
MYSFTPFRILKKDPEQQTQLVQDLSKTQLGSLHLDYLDGLRALAALYVVLCHASLHVDVDQSSFSLAGLLYKLVHKGHYSVDFFIVISGFCLMLPVVRRNGIMRDSTFQFIRKRAKRILPPYYLAMGFTLLLIATLIGQDTGTIWHKSIPVTSWDIVTHLFLIQDVFEDTFSTINYAFWSISVEWRIYFLFPLLVLSWRKLGPFTTTLATILLTPMLWLALLPTDLNTGINGVSVHYVALFTLGMLAAHISFSEQALCARLRDKLPWKAIAVAVILVGLSKFALERATGLTLWILTDIMIGIAAAGLLLTITSGKLPLLHKFLSWQPLVFIGTFAYSIYLIHAPLLQVLSQYMVAPLNLSPLAGILSLFFFSFTLILGASYLFFLVAERPFMRKKNITAKAAPA